MFPRSSDSVRPVLWGGAALLCLGLTACGGGSGDVSDTRSATGVTAATPTAQALRAIRPEVDGSTPYIGVGINQISYYDGSHAMADLVRHSQFRSNSWGDAVVDTDGAPTTDFLMIFSSRRMAAGTYHLSFRGQASVGASGSPEDGSNNRPYVQNLQYDPAANLTTAEVVIPTVVVDNAWISFSDTRRTAGSPTNTGLTELHLWRPGYATDGSALFTSEFIAAMQKFHVIRGMDFVSANSNPSVNWSDRTTMRHLGMVGSAGQPWELLVALANATGRDLWINVPVRASDDYLRKLAQLIRYGSDGVNPYTQVQANPVHPPLAGGLRVYVEYGNELWNSGPGFHGYGWALDLSAAVRGDTRHPIAYDGSLANDPYLALRRWIAYRSASISLAFRGVFGDTLMMRTVRPVLAGQVGDGNVFFSEALRWADGFYGQVRATAPINRTARAISDLWWGGGGAAYYESDVAPSDTSETTMAAYFAGLPSAQFARDTATDAIWARGYGLKSVAYEGGPGPGGSPTGAVGAPPQLSAIYNADPRMAGRMLAAQAQYEANGGQMLVYYVYSGSPPWNFVNDLTPDLVSGTVSTKLQAIDTLRTSARHVPTLGTSVPGTVWLQDPASSIRTYGGASWAYDNQAIRFGIGTRGRAFAESALIPIRSESGGSYSFSINTLDAPSGGQMELLINGKSVGVWKLQASTSGQPQGSVSLKATLPAGLSVARIRPLNNAIWVRDLVVK